MITRSCAPTRTKIRWGLCLPLLAFLFVGLTSSQALAVPRGKLVFSRWNRGSCQLTDTVRFRVSKRVRGTWLVFWRSWGAERSIRYTLLQANNRGGNITRTMTKGACDSRQRNWCEAKGLIGNTFVPGITYTYKVPAGRLCKNRQSRGQAFVRIYCAGPGCGSGATAARAPSAARRPSRGAFSVTGTYDARRPGRNSALVLRQRGNVVTGTYHNGASVLKGTLRGRVLTGTYGYKRRRPTTGRFVFRFSADGRQFSGKTCEGRGCTPKFPWRGGTLRQ